MGIIRAAINSVGGAFADQYGEVIEPPSNMSNNIVFAAGQKVRANDRRNTNKGTDNVVSNGSLIHVWPNSMMLLVDGGRVIAASCEEGYYQVSDSTSPSIFAGQWKDALKDTFERVKFGGTTPRSQRVFYINMQEIRGIKFGTENAMNYFDAMYQAELFIRAHGTYSIKIVDPMKFYTEVVDRGSTISNSNIDINAIKQQFNGEFLTELRNSLGQMSIDGYPIYQIHGNTKNLTKYLNTALDDEWRQLRGFEIVETTISVSYDQDSEKIVKSRSEGMMFGNQQVQSGYMAKNIAEGLKNAGSNSGGAMNSFIGMGMGMNMAGNVMQGYQQQNYGQQQGGFVPPQPQQPQQRQQAANSWRCECGASNTGKFCNECGKPKPQQTDGWKCECGTVNKGKFCSECGKPMPSKAKCSKCGFEPPEGQSPKFCPNCGNKL